MGIEIIDLNNFLHVFHNRETQKYNEYVHHKHNHRLLNHGPLPHRESKRSVVEEVKLLVLYFNIKPNSSFKNISLYLSLPTTELLQDSCLGPSPIFQNDLIFSSKEFLKKIKLMLINLILPGVVGISRSNPQRYMELKSTNWK